MEKTRSAAIAAGESYYFTGIPCARGHVAKRRAYNYNCAECHRLENNRQHWANRDKRLQKQKEYRDRPEVSAIKVAEAKRWASDNPEKVLAIKAKYRESHKDLLRAKSRQYHESNRPAHAERQSRRHRYKGAATPAWANVAEIKAVYEQAAQLNLTVDHIVPLKHKRVCGLHVPCNLELIPRIDNLRKGNRFNV